MVQTAAVEAVSAGSCLRLASLLAARVCHDLASNLGAVVSALQLARDPSQEHPGALALAEEAGMDMVHRLRLLRAAWGGDNEEITPDDLRRLSLGLGRGRIAVRLSGIDPDTRFAAAPASLVLNVMLLGAECLSQGGILTMIGDGSRELLVSISGPGAAWTPGFLACVAAPEVAWARLSQESDGSVGGLQSVLTALIAHDSGLGISVLMGREAEAAPPLLLRLSR